MLPPALRLLAPVRPVTGAGTNGPASPASPASAAPASLEGWQSAERAVLVVTPAADRAVAEARAEVRFAGDDLHRARRGGAHHRLALGNRTEASRRRRRRTIRRSASRPRESATRPESTPSSNGRARTVVVAAGEDGARSAGRGDDGHRQRAKPRVNRGCPSRLSRRGLVEGDLVAHDPEVTAAGAPDAPERLDDGKRGHADRCRLPRRSVPVLDEAFLSDGPRVVRTEAPEGQRGTLEEEALRVRPLEAAVRDLRAVVVRRNEIRVESRRSRPTCPSSCWQRRCTARPGETESPDRAAARRSSRRSRRAASGERWPRTDRTRRIRRPGSRDRCPRCPRSRGRRGDATRDRRRPSSPSRRQRRRRRSGARGPA